MHQLSNLSTREQAALYKARNQGSQNPITGSLNPHTIPRKCAVSELNLPDKEVSIIGTAHTQGIKDQTHIDQINTWLRQIITNATTKSAIFFEVPENILKNQAIWDEREMFVALGAKRNDCSAHSTEPSNEERITKMLSEPYLSRWLKDENGNPIQADNPEDNPKKYKGHSANEIYKAFKEVRNSIRLKNYKLKNEYRKIANDFDNEFEEHLSQEPLSLHAPSSWLKKKISQLHFSVNYQK